MPANIAAAAPTTVLPQTLLTSFSESREYATLQNTLHDGTPLIGQLALTSRRTFKLSAKLTATQIATLRAFWVSLTGGLTPFYYYNPYEGTPIGYNYDATGVSTTGRHTVVFQGNWSQSTDMQRSSLGLTLIEVA